jgi:FPC/CPF motif-containing protein YcgG
MGHTADDEMLQPKPGILFMSSFASLRISVAKQPRESAQRSFTSFRMTWRTNDVMTAITGFGRQSSSLTRIVIPQYGETPLHALKHASYPHIA